MDDVIIVDNNKYQLIIKNAHKKNQETDMI